MFGQGLVRIIVPSSYPFISLSCKDEDVTEVSSLRKVGEKVGISGDILDKMEAMIQTEEMKKRLEQRVQEAVNLGVRFCCFIA